MALDAAQGAPRLWMAVVLAPRQPDDFSKKSCRGAAPACCRAWTVARQAEVDPNRKLQNLSREEKE